MTKTESLFSFPKSVTLKNRGNKNRVNNKLNLIVHGQGVFLFKLCENIDNSNLASFNINDNKGINGLNIEFNEKSVNVTLFDNLVEIQLIDENNKEGLSSKNGAYYWFSIDSQNQKLQAGIGEARIENMIYQYIFPKTSDEERRKNKFFLESLENIDCFINNCVPLQLLRDPITAKVPLLIKETKQLTMKHIAEYSFLPKSHLSIVAQQLYDCISGKKFVLDDDDFPYFSQAIEYSIITPGLWCYERLKEKSGEFDKENPNILETYLRITLNQNNGESPGIPYVLEIWPIGHYSPVHNHGGSNAVIRVLHGKINVKLYPFLCDEKEGIEPFNEIQFVKDDITWISPGLNQVHQLTNLTTNNETCITIQCYLYDEKDIIHYDYFDYLDGNGNKNQYEPDSDSDFITFKEIMKEEWNNNPNKPNTNCSSFFNNMKKQFLNSINCCKKYDKI
jgi:hypothetical protein